MPSPSQQNIVETKFYEHCCSTIVPPGEYWQTGLGFRWSDAGNSLAWHLFLTNRLDTDKILQYKRNHKLGSELC